MIQLWSCNYIHKYMLIYVFVYASAILITLITLCQEGKGLCLCWHSWREFMSPVIPYMVAELELWDPAENALLCSPALLQLWRPGDCYSQIRCTICGGGKILKIKRVATPVPQHWVAHERSHRLSLVRRNDQGWTATADWTTWQFAASFVAVDPDSNNFSEPFKALHSSRTKLGLRWHMLSNLTWISSSESTRMWRRVSVFEKEGSGATSLNLAKVCSWQRGTTLLRRFFEIHPVLSIRTKSGVDQSLPKAQASRRLYITKRHLET